MTKLSDILEETMEWTPLQKLDLEEVSSILKSQDFKKKFSDFKVEGVDVSDSTVILSIHKGDELMMVMTPKNINLRCKGEHKIKSKSFFEELKKYFQTKKFEFEIKDHVEKTTQLITDINLSEKFISDEIKKQLENVKNKCSFNLISLNLVVEEENKPEDFITIRHRNKEQVTKRLAEITYPSRFKDEVKKVIE